MHFGIQAGAGSYYEYLEWARFAEDRGLSGFAIPDHYVMLDRTMAALDAMAVLGGLARETESIELVLLVSPITWRHPAVLAKTYATIDLMSRGRFTLGVGTGWRDSEHEYFGIPFPERRVRFEMLEEALRYLRAAFSDPPASFEGDHYSFQAFDMQPRPPLRLLVGGTGSRTTPRLAGTYADEFNAYPAPIDDYAAKVERARAAARDSGRDPAGLRVSSSGFLVAGEDENEWRSKLHELASLVGASPEDVQQSLRERNAPVGTWEEVIATLAAYRQTGMERFWIQTAGDDRDWMARALDRLTA